MLENIHSAEDLLALARAKARDYERRTINPKLLDELKGEGWVEDKKNKSSIRVKRPKPIDRLLEDRVWTLLYRMRFLHLPGPGGASLVISPSDEKSPRSQIDVAALDDEIALCIECKAAENRSRRSGFSEELAKLAMLRQSFSQAVAKQFPIEHKRQVVLAMFLSNAILSDNDKTRAREANVILFDERDLAYYESLISHLGSAAKYQFFADMMPGKEVPGLRIRMPAIRFKMGGSTCYGFTVSPDYLLKICYVSHRSKGKASDIDAYQRMVSRSRLSKIKRHISDKGFFPTSIVVNLEAKKIRFDQVKQESDGDEECGVLGWLEIRPAYKTAWIIDGQHRLFAYSGHERAAKSKLAVMAFSGLPPSQQARLFIEINSKQKKVSQILLQTLVAELNWDADDPEVRLGAIISKAIQELDADPESAFHQRIQTSDDPRDTKQCITINSLLSAVERAQLHIAKIKHGAVVEFGPLWAVENDATKKRTTFILDGWFRIVREAVPDWWDKGAEPGGGLAMNDGVTSCIKVLQSVFEHLEDRGKKLVHLDNDDLLELIRRYGKQLGTYLAGLSEAQRKHFRDLRGTQGITARYRRCQKAIREQIPDFDPRGLAEFLELEKAQTNQRAKEIIDRIERTLQKVVLAELRQNFGDDEKEWWILGIPQPVRIEVSKRHEEDNAMRGGKENYFDLIHYRKIIADNWELFQDLLGYGKKGVSKEKRTVWIVEVNERRKVVAHASAAVTLSLEDLAELQEYDSWLAGQACGTQSIEDSGNPESEA
jgi:DNA sulfur modification protein DndB